MSIEIDIKRHCRYFKRLLNPKTAKHKLFKEWLDLQQTKCVVCDMYGENFFLKCDCDKRKLRQKEIEKELKKII